MKKGKIAPALLAILLSACATKPVPPPVVNLEAMACDRDFVFSDPIVTQFDPKSERTITAVLDNQVRCLREAEGTKALYRVFTLPDTPVPYVIAVRALPWGDTILAPKTVLLDDGGHITRSTQHEDFTFRGQTLSTLLRSHSGEKYLVIASDAQVLGNKVSRVVADVHQTMGATAYGTFYIYTGSDKTNNMTLTPSGRVELTLTPIQPDSKQQ
jgi:hypothetical protein